MKYKLVLEVEYVRKQKITVDLDDEETKMWNSYSPPGYGWVERSIQYHMHSNKDLVKGEEPRLIRWTWLPLVCQYPDCTNKTDDNYYCNNHNK